MISACELDIHDLSRPRDGEVDRWVRWAVTVACLVTFLIAAVVPRVLRQHVDGELFDSFWLEDKPVDAAFRSGERRRAS